MQSLGAGLGSIKELSVPKLEIHALPRGIEKWLWPCTAIDGITTFFSSQVFEHKFVARTTYQPESSAKYLLLLPLAATSLGSSTTFV